MFLTLTKRRLDCRYMYFADMCAKHIQTPRSTSPRFSRLMQSTMNSHGNCCGLSSRWPELIGSSWWGSRLLSHRFGEKEWKPRCFGECWESGEAAPMGTSPEKLFPSHQHQHRSTQHHRPALWPTNNPGNGKWGGQERGARVHNRNKRSQHSGCSKRTQNEAETWD